MFEVTEIWFHIKYQHRRQVKIALKWLNFLLVNTVYRFKAPKLNPSV